MIIKIPSNKVKDRQFGMINSEPLIVYLIDYTNLENNILKFTLGIETENSYLNGLNKRSSVLEFPNNFTIDVSEMPITSVHAIKILKEYLETEYNLTGLTILAEAQWQTEFGINVPIPRNIRVSISDNDLIDKYDTLIVSLKQEWDALSIAKENYPYKQREKNRIVYLEEIDATTKQILESDINVLIEYNI